MNYQVYCNTKLYLTWFGIPGIPGIILVFSIRNYYIILLYFFNIMAIFEQFGNLNYCIFCIYLIIFNFFILSSILVFINLSGTTILILLLEAILILQYLQYFAQNLCFPLTSYVHSFFIATHNRFGNYYTKNRNHKHPWLWPTTNKTLFWICGN